MNQKTTAHPIDTQRYLSNMDYPARKQTLITTARQQGANDEVLNALENLPDQEYNSPAEVTQAVTT